MRGKGKAVKTCSVTGCKNSHFGRGYCQKHYNRWRAHGDPNIVLKSPGPARSTFEETVARFFALVNKTNFCWLWTGSKHPKGYGKFSYGSKPVLAHRFSYKLAHPEWDEIADLDHFKCDNPPCVNPDHVRPATNRENVLRGIGIAAMNARKTHCIHGHEFSIENTYYRPNGARDCRTCMRMRHESYKNRD